MQEWMKTTTINPLGVALLVILGLASLMLRRQYAAIPMMIMACFVAPGQNIVVGGFSFYLLRTLGYIVTLRCIVRSEFSGFRWNRVDTAVLVYSIFSTAIYTITTGTDGLIMKFGHLSDGVLIYYISRALFRNLADVKSMAVACSVISIPVVVAFFIEHATGRNMFALFGGVPDVTVIREGRLRCQGAFAHPILAGCAWASLLPLMAVLWWEHDWKRWISFIGTACALAVVGFCASSTPVVGLVAAVVGTALYPVRMYMRQIRWCTVALLFILHMIMSAPVWSLVQRVDIIGGSTGNFRYRLIDGAINNFDRWWLWGERDPEVWGWGLHDVTNQYLVEAVRGGFASMVLFILIFVFAFGHVGKLVRAAPTTTHRIVYWCLGIALALHCVNFMGASYFGQIITLLWIQVGMVVSLQPSAVRRAVLSRHAKVANRPVSAHEAMPASRPARTHV
jgi:hypothetical protein